MAVRDGPVVGLAVGVAEEDAVGADAVGVDAVVDAAEEEEDEVHSELVVAGALAAPRFFAY